MRAVPQRKLISFLGEGRIATRGLPFLSSGDGAQGPFSYGVQQANHHNTSKDTDGLLTTDHYG